mmetsp:Transcript_31705/g.63315  ORF Transcript_31705/g.63315 Transcript_31705/m.63315 type:complete len:234 (+) Transcript_31705:208-909(+)
MRDEMMCGSRTISTMQKPSRSGTFVCDGSMLQASCARECPLTTLDYLAQGAAGNIQRLAPMGSCVPACTSVHASVSRRGREPADYPVCETRGLASATTALPDANVAATGDGLALLDASSLRLPPGLLPRRSIVSYLQLEALARLLSFCGLLLAELLRHQVLRVRLALALCLLCQQKPLSLPEGVERRVRRKNKRVALLNEAHASQEGTDTSGGEEARDFWVAHAQTAELLLLR